MKPKNLVRWIRSHCLPATKYDLEQLEKRIMITLDDVLNDVTDETTKIDSLGTFVAGLKQQVADALAGVLTPAQQTKVDAIFAAVETNKAKVVAAMDANTTPTPAS
jgi:hypothetical protein